MIVKNGKGETQTVSFAETQNQTAELRARLVRENQTAPSARCRSARNSALNVMASARLHERPRCRYQRGAERRDPRADASSPNESNLPSVVPTVLKSASTARGTPGYSQDAMRAFARNMFHGGYHLAKLNYGDQLQSSLMQMQADIDDKIKTDPRLQQHHRAERGGRDEPAA